MTQVQIPLPNDTLGDTIVVASVWLNDEPPDPPMATLVLLHKEVPYFGVAVVRWTPSQGWHVLTETRHYNIVPTIDEYKDQGGDY